MAGVKFKLIITGEGQGWSDAPGDIFDGGEWRLDENSISFISPDGANRMVYSISQDGLKVTVKITDADRVSTHILEHDLDQNKIKVTSTDPRASALEHHNGVSPSMFIRISSFQAARLRLIRRLVLAESVLSARIRLRTIFLRSERFWGGWSLRTVLPSSPMVTSRTQ